MCRCKACNVSLKEFDDDELCSKCILASKDTTTSFKDCQHILITEVVDLSDSITQKRG